MNSEKILKSAKNGYNALRKMTLGQTYEEAQNDTRNIIDIIKEKLFVYIILFVVMLVVNWKITLAIVLVLFVSYFLNVFISDLKKAKIDAEKEINEEKLK